VASLPTVQAVKDYVRDYTKPLRAFHNWSSDYKYQAGDPCYYNGHWYYANPENPPEKGQNPEGYIDHWNLMSGEGSGESQTVRKRIKISQPGVKIVNLSRDLDLSESLQYRITPALVSNYPYFRNIFVERRGNDLWIYLYCDTEPYLYPRIGYLHGSTKGINAKIGTKLVGTFYLGKYRVAQEEIPLQETELRIGEELLVGQFIVGYVPPRDEDIIRVGDDLVIGQFYAGEKTQEVIDDEEISDEQLPGIFIDLFIQREV